jgi:Xaa-Pro aminopeptidase
MLINLERAQALMAEAGLDAVVLVTPPNVIYASDVASEYLLGGFEDYTHAVVVPASKGTAPALVMPDNDLPHLAVSPSWIDDVYPFGNPWSSIGLFMGETLEHHLADGFRSDLQKLRRNVAPRQVGSLVEAVTKALGDRGLTQARVGCDDLAIARTLEERGIAGGKRIPHVRQLMRSIRAIKTAEELEILTRAARINGVALTKAATRAHEGMRETDLIRSWRLALTEQDARHGGDRGMLFGTGDASAFYLPSDEGRTLRAGDTVVLDCIGSYKRYYMDMARTAVVGSPSKEVRHRHRAVETAVAAAIDHTRPGVHTAQIQDVILKTIESFGLKSDTTSALTHGIGLEVFEFPVEDGLSKGFQLEAGMVVNSEVFYRDVEFGGFHLEDTVAVTANGCRPLADVPRDLIAL